MIIRVAAVLALLASPVLAQAPGADLPAPQPIGADENPPPPPAQQPAAQPAPQNEPWSNVSHINGQLVPVGEHNAYLYRFRRTNISTNPIGWIIGFYGVSVETALSRNIALRFDANYWSLDHGNTQGYEVGASVPIYFRRAYSGPFLEPGIVVHATKPNYEYAGAPAAICGNCGGGYSQPSMQTWTGPEVMIGWHWIFDSGLNVALAFGAAKPLTNTDSGNDDAQPEGYFRVGYAF